MNPIDIRPADLATVRRILREHVPSLEVRAFGSRVTWNARDTSDLDLALITDEPLTVARIADLRAAFTGTDLPFRVDIVDWASTSEGFRRVIEAEYVVLDSNGRSSPADWICLTLANACSAIDYGLTASASNQPCGPRFLRITDIVSEPINWNSVPYVAAADSTTEKYRLHDGDIVIARTGASTGASAYIKDPPHAVFASYLVRLRAKPDFSARFLAYVLKSEGFRKYIRGVLGDKSAQPNASASTMTAAPIRAPRNKVGQLAIADILGTLDDKIELNRRMNATLEAMARALFRSWFVDFDPVRAKLEGRDTGLPTEIAELFPDRLTASKLGDVPAGWHRGTLADVALLNPESWGGHNRPDRILYVDLATTKWGYINEIQMYSWTDAPSRGRRVLRRGDTIVGTVRPGNGSFALIDRDGLTGSTGFAVLRPTDPIEREIVWCAATSADALDRLAHLADGGAYPAVSPKAVLNAPLVLPDEPVRLAFSSVAAPLLNRLKANQREARTLGTLRDALLPKLVSGELRVIGLEPASVPDHPAPVGTHGA